MKNYEKTPLAEIAQEMVGFLVNDGAFSKTSKHDFVASWVELYARVQNAKTVNALVRSEIERELSGDGYGTEEERKELKEELHEMIQRWTVNLY